MATTPPAGKASKLAKVIVGGALPSTRRHWACPRPSSYSVPGRPPPPVVPTFDLVGSQGFQQHIERHPAGPLFGPWVFPLFLGPGPASTCAYCYFTGPGEFFRPAGANRLQTQHIFLRQSSRCTGWRIDIMLCGPCGRSRKFPCLSVQVERSRGTWPLHAP